MMYCFLHEIKKLLYLNVERLCNQLKVVDRGIEYATLEPADHRHVNVAVDSQLGLGHAFVHTYLFQMRTKCIEEGGFVKLFNHIQKSVLMGKGI